MAISTIPSVGLATSVANPVTQVDWWLLTTSFAASAGANTLTTNLARNTVTAYFKPIGSGMTQSSGIFTFPTTGMYQVSFTVYGVGGNTSPYVGGGIYLSTDGGSTFGYTIAEGYQGIWANTAYVHQVTTGFVNVTSTANIKVRFRIDTGNASTTINGTTSGEQTGMRFIRIGDAQ
jgi:hypothetical protein